MSSAPTPQSNVAAEHRVALGLPEVARKRVTADVAVAVLVVGSGLAGLSFALRCRHRCLVVDAGQGSSWFAQGGIAAAIDADDSAAVHAADTMRVTGGLADADAVTRLTGGAAAAIEFLAGIGVQFDRRDAASCDGDTTLPEYLLSREAGHSRSRIVHVGDRTGAAVMAVLRAAVSAATHITVAHGLTLRDLCVDGGVVSGAVFSDGRRDVVVSAGAVVLATCGFGHLWSPTSVPASQTGGGLAAAFRAGAAAADVEFVQFHPTALACGADPLPLLTEALRGDGALLVDRAGGRVMVGVHPDCELAPRNVVATALAASAASGVDVYLDARAVAAVRERYTHVAASADGHGLDIARDLLPVTPAAHYVMGGVAVDAGSQSSVPGLWVVGEAAATFVHGANRLASNSLLEAVVDGTRLAGVLNPGSVAAAVSAPHQPLGMGGLTATRTLLSRHVGLVHDELSMRSALPALELLAQRSAPGLVGLAVTKAALARRESRGAHVRSDFPLALPAAHSRVVHGG